MVVLGSDTDFSCEGFAVENIHENTQDEDLPYDTIKFQQVENINDQNLYEKFFIGKVKLTYQITQLIKFIIFKGALQLCW